MKNPIITITKEFAIRRSIQYKQIEDSDYAIYEEVKVTMENEEKKTTIERGVSSIKTLKSLDCLEAISHNLSSPVKPGEKATLVWLRNDTLTAMRSGKIHIKNAVEKDQKICPFSHALTVPEGYGIYLFHRGSNTIADLSHHLLALPISAIQMVL